MNNSFKDKEDIMRNFARDYQKSKIIELKGVDLLVSNVVSDSVNNYMNTKKEYDYYYSLQTKIEYILDNLEFECSSFLRREFFCCGYRNNWWQNYYSRSTYYRIKSKAMDAFLGLIYA